MTVPIFETNKKSGVQYAVNDDGLELPVVDVTHPAFALSVTEAEQRELVEKFLREGNPLKSLPAPLRNLVLRFLLRGSFLAQGIAEARGTFMSGMQTYLLKIGPEMLGSALATPMDRRIAASLPAVSVRLRLQDVASMMSDALAGPLSKEPHRPLYFVNIAGGPAIDSLNSLILLEKKDFSLLGERQVSIHVLDLDDAGPTFGKAALSALCGEGAPLHGTQVNFVHVRYDWSEPKELKMLLSEAHAKGALVICSLEGGLFEYGTDQAIETNLNVLRAGDVLAVVGSVTRADEPAQRVYRISGAATIKRGLPAFRNLVQRTGWTLARAIERPFSDQVLLT